MRAGFAGAAFVAVLLIWAHAPRESLPDNARATRVVVDKRDRLLSLYDGGRLLRQYEISLGARPDGHKRQEGDERTPEGYYTLDWRNDISAAYRALHVSYPDTTDRREARAAGRDPGGFIMVHGIRNGLGWLGRLHRLVDWTDGCIAVTNPEMDEIARVVPVGTPVEIRQ